jgi:hypothetical protein
MKRSLTRRIVQGIENEEDVEIAVCTEMNSFGFYGGFLDFNGGDESSIHCLLRLKLHLRQRSSSMDRMCSRAAKIAVHFGPRPLEGVAGMSDNLLTYLAWVMFFGRAKIAVKWNGKPTGTLVLLCRL